jgi:hypothetical protein
MVVERAAVLQGEAWGLVERLGLGEVFPWRAEVIGSALSGLMVVRDLDLMFDAPGATAAEVLEGIARLGRRVELRSVDFRDERGDRRPTPAISDERFYAVLHTETWKIDLTFWLHVVERPHVRDALRLAAATDAQKLTILQLKTEQLKTSQLKTEQLTTESPEFSSTEIYAAVLDRGVRTIAELRGE